jgi:polysaccharide biosynthesis protein PslF
MNLVLVCGAYPPHDSGEALYAFRMKGWFESQGHRVRVATAGTGGEISVGAWDWAGGDRLLAALEKGPADAVVLHYTDWIYDHPMVTFLPRLLENLSPRPRFVTLFHNHIPGPIEGWLKKRASVYRHGSLLSRSDRVVVLADWHRERLGRLDKSVVTRTETLPVFSFLERTRRSRAECRKALGLDPDSFWISFYGYVYADKDLETLFRAVSFLRGQGTEARVLLVGGAPRGRERFDREWRMTAERLGVSPYVHALGRHDGLGEAPSLALTASDVCVLPYKGGASTRRSSLAAALAHGLPVLSTLGPETPHELVDREGLTLFREGDARGLARELSRLVSEEARLPRGRDALRLHAEHFAFEPVMERFESLLLPNHPH